MAETRPFGLYVHWPFCQSKCPYCDFNSHVVRTVDHDQWVSAFTKEIARLRAWAGPRVLNSIFFGGGTPSLMQPETVEAIISKAQTSWTFANDIEITLEANPTSVEAQKFEAFRLAGVNRVSVGLQALNDADLRALGRRHSAQEGRAAFEIAQKIFPQTSFDLIYGRQNQTLDHWVEELGEALSFGGDHMSLYQLTIEPGTAFGDRHKLGKLPGLPNDDLGADFYEVTQALTAEAGLLAYEISNHARRGFESRHNQIYWTSGDWCGVGPGAHGRLTRNAKRYSTEAKRAPAEWLSNVASGSSVEITEEMTDAEVLEERLMMGLRLVDGIECDVSHEVINKINSLSEFPLLETHGEKLRLTPEGRPLLNAVLRELLT